MKTTENGAASPTRENGRLYIEGLLAKDPATTDHENPETFTFTTKAPVLDVALLTCKDAISEKLERFKAADIQEITESLRKILSQLDDLQQHIAAIKVVEAISALSCPKVAHHPKAVV